MAEESVRYWSKSFVKSGLHLKQAFSSKEDQAILTAATNGERATIKKYDECIADCADHADHLKLLTEQRDGVRFALSEIERRIVSENTALGK